MLRFFIEKAIRSSISAIIPKAMKSLMIVEMSLA